MKPEDLLKFKQANAIFPSMRLRIGAGEWSNIAYDETLLHRLIYKKVKFNVTYNADIICVTLEDK